MRWSSPVVVVALTAGGGREVLVVGGLGVGQSHRSQEDAHRYDNLQHISTNKSGLGYLARLT